MGVEIERCVEEVSWEELIERLLHIFQQDSVNVEEVEELLARYRWESGQMLHELL